MVIPNLSRTKKSAKTLGKIFKTNSYLVEQLSFFIAFVPVIIRKRPRVIYYSDFILGTYLWHLRKEPGLSTGFCFAMAPQTVLHLKTEDHVQQLLPFYIEDAVKKGESVLKQTVLPYGFNINIKQRFGDINSKEITRKNIGFLPGQKIILSVGAINNNHKRMEYVINETAMSGEDNFLVILGQFENETTALIELAKVKLPGRHIIKNVPHKEVEKYYIAADYFVLASLSEGFPRATIEALSFGLPCIVHDYVITRQVLQQCGIYIDMRIEGALSNCLNETGNFNGFDKQELTDAAYNLYSWDKLKERYADMIIGQLNY